MRAHPLLYAFLAAGGARAELSVYTTAKPTPTPAPAPDPNAPYTGFKAYDPTIIAAPPLPDPMPALAFAISLPAGGVPGLSQPQMGNVLGVSIELSLASTVLGPSGQYIHPQFLNLMAAFKKRGGSPIIRLGGNTQEKAVLVDSLPSGKSLEKSNTGATGATDTPTVVFTMDILYTLGNISQILDVHWWLGIPMNQTGSELPRLRVAEEAERLFGDHVVGYQLGNEPDLFGSHGYRAATYGVQDYFSDFAGMISAIDADAALPLKKRIGAPSLCCNFTIEDVIAAGWKTQSWIPTHLNTLLVENYITNNCPGNNFPPAPVLLDEYMNHSSALGFAAMYTAHVADARDLGVPIVMLETNTASCGGFLGLSDAFGAALWAVDVGLQFASINFTNVMLHLGGQGVYYNPFVPPPANQSTYDDWTVGPVWYANLVVAETLGSSGKAQIADLGNPNGGSVHTPAYAVYEGGAPARALLLNFLTDPAGGGAADYVATLTVAGVTQAWVRTLRAPSTAWKGNITWGGQTYGGHFATDGTLQGAEETTPLACPGGVCAVHVPGPGLALVFFSAAALAASGVGPGAPPTATYTTSVFSKTPRATLAPGVIADSNGHGGKQFPVFGASSKEGVASGARARRGWAGVAALVAAVLAAAALA